MSLAQAVAILINKRPATIGSIVLDASVSEVHTSSSTITDHPVESGSNITDHAHKNPDVIQITGVISNTSTVFPQALPGVALVQSFDNLVSGVSNDLAQTAYVALKSLIDNRELVTIETTLRTYENMLLENLTVNRDAASGDSLNFTCSAKEIRIVSVATIQERIQPADRKKASKKSLGKKANKPVAAPVETKASTAASLYRGIF